jgi:hypothetical protein
MTLTQEFNVTGELNIISPIENDLIKGSLNFLKGDRTKLGSLRLFGFQQSNFRLILDTSGVDNGFSFRTSPYQGTTTEGGQGYPYAMNVGPTYTQINEPTTISPLYSQNGDSNLVNLTVEKTQDTLQPAYSRIMVMQMTNFQPDQLLLCALGTSSTSYRSVWGYRGGKPVITDNYGFIGMTSSSSSSPYENVQLYRGGAVKVPLSLECPRFLSSGTTGMFSNAGDPESVVTGGIGSLCMDTTNGFLYQKRSSAGNTGWTRIDSGSIDVNPVTLDPTNGRVGINQTNPSQALDITGNAQVSGWIMSNEVDTDNLAAVHIITNTINAATYQNLPAPVVTPITLDATNGRVGINQPTPVEALDVTGNIQASGSIQATTLQGDDLLVTDITTSTINAGTYLNLPAPNLLPLTLDKTNNRVGINKTTPVEALDVTGNIQASGSIQATTLQGDDLLVTDITTSTINAGTYLNLPAPNLLPITLDKTNNRVGINVTAPVVPLEVLGDAWVRGNAFIDGNINTPTVSIQSGTGTPEGVKTANVGSIFMRNDGTTGTTLYTKTSGTGNTGWQTIPIGTMPTTTTYSNSTNYSSAAHPPSNETVMTICTLAANSTYTISGTIRYTSTLTGGTAQMVVVNNTSGTPTPPGGLFHTVYGGGSLGTSYSTSFINSATEAFLACYTIQTTTAQTLYLNFYNLNNAAGVVQISAGNAKFFVTKMA